MPPGASGCDIGIRGGSGAYVANTTAPARIMRRGRSEGEYLVPRHKATVLVSNVMASCSKSCMIDRSI